MTTDEKLLRLQDTLRGFGTLAVAFSGGVDSCFLLHVAHETLGERALALTVDSVFIPRNEITDAESFCRERGIRQQILRMDPLAIPGVAANPPDRCYFCKRVIMSTIKAAAKADGFDLVLDGTNASDDISDRPGYRALEEEGVLSPLRLCGLTKARIRELSQEAGLFTWDKPAYACLATRVKTGEPITNERLAAIEESEDYLFSRGFTDFRVRTAGKTALLQFPARQLERAKSEETEIVGRLRAFFESVHIDPEGRKTGL